MQYKTIYISLKKPHNSSWDLAFVQLTVSSCYKYGYTSTLTILCLCIQCNEYAEIYLCQSYTHPWSRTIMTKLKTSFLRLLHIPYTGNRTLDPRTKDIKQFLCHLITYRFHTSYDKRQWTRYTWHTKVFCILCFILVWIACMYIISCYQTPMWQIQPRRDINTLCFMQPVLIFHNIILTRIWLLLDWVVKTKIGAYTSNSFVCSCVFVCLFVYVCVCVSVCL